MLLKNSYYLIALLGLFLSACVHRPPKMELNFDAEIVVTQKNANVVFVPANLRMPPYLLVTKTETYHFSGQAGTPFKREITISPLMYEATLSAQVQMNGKVVREYKAQKVAQTIVNEKQRIWTPGRSKLSLVIPYLKAGEEVVLTTSYSWMDIRWHPPILFEEDVPTFSTLIHVDVPFGIRTHFQVMNDGQPFAMTPSNIEQENKLWGQSDNKMGLGNRFVFQNDFGTAVTSRPEAKRLQLFFSFEPPTQSERNPPFDNWERVASYLYDRIDRYDFPSNAIRDFTTLEGEKQTSDVAKAVRIFSFLNNDIEKRAVNGSYLDQDVQPATKTFAKRFGSPFDIAILAKAMLSSLGLSAEILAVSNEQINPDLESIFSPALFYSVVAAVTIEGKTYFYDPEQAFENITSIPDKLYGAKLLTIRKTKGHLYSMPLKPVETVVPEQTLGAESPLPELILEPSAEPKAPLLEIKPPELGIQGEQSSDEEPKIFLPEESAQAEPHTIPTEKAPVEEPKMPIPHNEAPVILEPTPMPESAPPSEEPKPVPEEKKPAVEDQNTTLMDKSSSPEVPAESLFEDRVSIEGSHPTPEKPHVSEEPHASQNP